MSNQHGTSYYYAEGYAKNIKVERSTKGHAKMQFEFDSDLKSLKSLPKGPQPLYAASSNGKNFDNVKNYEVGNETDSFSMSFYADCLINNAPLHVGIYFQREGGECDGNKSKFVVESFRIVDEYR